MSPSVIGEKGPDPKMVVCPTWGDRRGEKVKVGSICFLVGSFNPFHQTMGESGRAGEVRIGTVLRRWLCEEGRRQLRGFPWLH